VSVTTILFGQRAGGKTLTALYIIIEALRRDPYVVVFTNMVIKVPELAEYLGPSVDIIGRIRFLDGRDAARTFWRYRVRRWESGSSPCPTETLSPVTHPGDKSPSSVDLTPLFADGSSWMRCLYVVDEFGLIFNSRQWAMTGMEALYWNDQAGKLEDRCVWMTPRLGAIDKALLSTADQVWEHENGRLAKLGGWFRKPQRFLIKKYNGHQAKKEDLFERQFRDLDLKVANCYETKAGLGFSGTGARHHDEPKGLPFWTIALVPVFVGLVAWGLLRAGGNVVRAKLAPATTNSAPGVPVAAPTGPVVGAGGPALTLSEMGSAFASNMVHRGKLPDSVREVIHNAQNPPPNVPDAVKPRSYGFAVIPRAGGVRETCIFWDWGTESVFWNVTNAPPGLVLHPGEPPRWVTRRFMERYVSSSGRALPSVPAPVVVPSPFQNPPSLPLNLSDGGSPINLPSLEERGDVHVE